MSYLRLVGELEQRTCPLPICCALLKPPTHRVTDRLDDGLRAGVLNRKYTMLYLTRAICFLCMVMTLVAGYSFTVVSWQTDALKQINDAARELLISLLNAETGQRGFLITDNQ